jgi:hypothetical protein
MVMDAVTRARRIVQLDAIIASHQRTIDKAHAKNRLAPQSVYGLKHSAEALRDKVASC